MNPSLGRAPSSGIEVRLAGGMRLPGRVFRSESPRVLVCVVHGLGEHGGRYAALASDLAQAGCTVVTLDLPGHGEAPGSRGDVPSWKLLRDAVVPAMFTATHGLPGQPAGLPRLVLGHSMGGVLALDVALAQGRALCGVVASAPALRNTLPPWWKLTLANVARITAPSLGFPNGIEVAGVSRDPEVLRLRSEDRLVHDRISPRLYFDFIEACQRVRRDARRLQIPALILQGDADRVVDPHGAAEFAAAAPASLVTLRTYPGAYHELFNDPAREQAIADVRRWLEGVIGR